MTRHLRWLALPLVAAACGGDPAAPPAVLTGLPRPLTAPEQRVRDASNGFAFGLLREVNRTHRDSNVFISRLSASMALGMTLNGAQGATPDSMRVALGVAGVPEAELNDGYKGLTALLRGLDRSTEIRIANSVWARNGLPVSPAFTATLGSYFGGAARTLDFGAPSAAPTINAWASENTGRKIQAIVDPPTPNDVVMYLINAVYFKGSWRDAFDPALTRDDRFAAPGGPVAVRMMQRKARWPVVRAGGATIVELPYGDGAFAMTIALPGAGASVEAFVADLTADPWRRWTAALADSASVRETELHLPKFRLDWRDSLNGPLRAVGMGIAFDSRRADFYRIADVRPDRLYISDVKPKSYVDVDERGTEAAAVTSVQVSQTSAGPPPVRVDRPFVVAIRERLTGSILFVGKVTRPGAPLGGRAVA